MDECSYCKDMPAQPVRVSPPNETESFEDCFLCEDCIKRFRADGYIIKVILDLVPGIDYVVRHEVRTDLLIGM